MTPEEVRLKARKALFMAAPSDVQGIVDDIVLEELGEKVLVSGVERLAERLIGGTIQSRAQMYTEAAYASYENNVVARETDEGVTLGRRVLEAGDNCEDCIAAATEEFVPLDTLPDIGDSVCGSRCRCEFEFSTEGGQFATSDLFTGVIAGQDAFGGNAEIQ